MLNDKSVRECGITILSCLPASCRVIQSKRYFEGIIDGNRDYGKIMPSTIGIGANEL